MLSFFIKSCICILLLLIEKGCCIYDTVFYIKHLRECGANITKEVWDKQLLSYDNYGELDLVLQIASDAITEKSKPNKLSYNPTKSHFPITDIFKRRDYIIAILTLAYHQLKIDDNQLIDYLKASFIKSDLLKEDHDKENFKYYLHSVTIAFFEEYMVDMINNGLLDNNKLFYIASQLPCIEINPEPFSTFFPIRYLIPNDPYLLPTINNENYLGQWYLGGPKIEYLKYPYAANVIEAWGLFRAEHQYIKVAILTRGCAVHPDLDINFLYQGALDIGRDFATGRKHPFFDSETKPLGTAIAGMIAASPHNSYGGSGICWRCKITCLKIYDDSGNLSRSALLEALEFISTSDIKLIYVGYSSSEFSIEEALLFEKLYQAGVLVIAPAGDKSYNIEEKHTQQVEGCQTVSGTCKKDIYPALYGTENLIVVGAVNLEGRKADFSNWGSKSVHLMAPGTELLLPTASSEKNEIQLDGYSYTEGTDYAAALVTGVAGLVWSSAQHLSAIELKEILLESTKKSSLLADICLAGGIIDAKEAMVMAAGIRDYSEPEPLRKPNILFIPKHVMTVLSKSHTVVNIKTIIFVLALHVLVSYRLI